MSHPPSGPQDPRPQDRPGQNSGWQSQPYQPQGYQPGNYVPGGQAAPPYGQPPKKNRAGLVIVLMLVILIAALGVGGVLAFGLVSDRTEGSPDPEPSVAPPASATPERSIPAPQPTKTFKPTVKPPVTPTVRPPVKPAGGPAELAQRFVAQLNANNPTAATALACADAKQFIPILMGQFIGPPSKLTVGDPIGQQPTFLVPLSGSTKGAAVSGMVIVQKLGSEPLCVRVFQVTQK